MRPKHKKLEYLIIGINDAWTYNYPSKDVVAVAHYDSK